MQASSRIGVVLRTAVLVGVVGVLATAARPAQASVSIYQSYNAGLTPGPYYWVPSNIGWYWTPATSLDLAGVETILRTGFTNINNNFTLTATLYTERPATGGAALGSVSFPGNVPFDGPWLGGLFSTPIALTGGTQYFLGFSGWNAVLTPSGGGGVNWIDPPTQPGASSPGHGSMWFGNNYDTQGNTTPGLAGIDFPVLRLLQQDPVPPTGVPEPSTIAAAIGGMLLVAGATRRRTRKS